MIMITLYWFCSVLVIALSTALLFHFITLVRYGSVVIQEPNSLILWGEIVMIVGCFIFGLFNAVYILLKIIRSRVG